MTAKIACPYCKHEHSKVVNTRPSKRTDGVWRRRECEACHRRFTTEEALRGRYKVTTTS